MAESFDYGHVAFEFVEEVDRLSDPGELLNAMERGSRPVWLR